MSSESGAIALMLAVLEEAARCIERGRQHRHPGIRKRTGEIRSCSLGDTLVTCDDSLLTR